MGSVIGSHLPYVTESEQADPNFNILTFLRSVIAWTQNLYEEVFDHHNADGEVDVLVAVDGHHKVLQYFVVRSSRDVDSQEPQDRENQILMGTPDVDPETWIASLIPIIHGVEGMVSWYWVHKHPEGLPMVTDNDNYMASVAQANDFIQTGHPGSVKQFQQYLVVNRSSVQQADARFSGISPEIDTEITRKFVQAYEAALGEDHAITVAESNKLAVMEKRLEMGEESNPIEMMKWGLMELMPAEMAIMEARQSMDRTKIEIALDISAWEHGFWSRDPVTGDHIRNDGGLHELDDRSRASGLAAESAEVIAGTRHIHEEWLAARERPSDGSVISGLRRLGFGKPTEAPTPAPAPTPEAPVVLSPTLLADLSGFDFSALD